MSRNRFCTLSKLDKTNCEKPAKIREQYYILVTLNVIITFFYQIRLTISDYSRLLNFAIKKTNDDINVCYVYINLLSFE